MLKIIISGCNGRMGRVVAALCDEAEDISVVAGFDILGANDREFPVFSSPKACTVTAEVVIDFSSSAALTPLLDYCMDKKLPVVLATTGYSPEQLAQIGAAAQTIPVFRSANMSLGINILLELVKKASAVLGDAYDVEIVERHHNKKVDAPSGTALMLADAAAAALPYDPQYVYERQNVRKMRDKHEIGISSIRGGTIVGDHEVIFAGRDEVIEIRHHAMSREIFASGALRAGRFLAAVSTPGLYDMSMLVAD
jgi:4-hydroxy-tetrahydrodipicolinate reductase